MPGQEPPKNLQPLPREMEPKLPFFYPLSMTEEDVQRAMELNP